MTILLVLTNLPNREVAESMAQFLVENQFAACVNILPNCHSVYRWKGSVEAADEVPLMIKTTEERYSSLEAAIRERHPYEIPEIVALPVVLGLPEYLAWLAAETKVDNWLPT